VGLDGTPVGFDETLHDGQAQAEPAVGSFARRSFLGEEVEDAPKRVGCDPDAGVANSDHDEVLLLRRQEADVPQGRNGKHKAIVTRILADLAQVGPGSAIKVPLADLKESKEKVRSEPPAKTRKGPAV